MKNSVPREGFHTTITDSYEDIQRCLNCPRNECVDCIGRRNAEKKSKVRRVDNGDRRVKINKTDIAFLHQYASAETDREIAKILGMSESNIGSVRKKLGLPPTRSMSYEAKAELADEWLAKVG